MQAFVHWEGDLKPQLNKVPFWTISSDERKALARPIIMDEMMEEMRICGRDKAQEPDSKPNSDSLHLIKKMKGWLSYEATSPLLSTHANRDYEEKRRLHEIHWLRHWKWLGLVEYVALRCNLCPLVLAIANDRMHLWACSWHDHRNQSRKLLEV